MQFSDQIVIENIEPTVSGGKYPYKANSGEPVNISADIFTHGNDAIDARIRYRKSGTRRWKYSPMRKGDNDRWAGRFKPLSPGMYEFTVQAWIDQYGGWIRNLRKWHDSGEDVSQDFFSASGMLSYVSKKATKHEKRLAKSISILFSDYSPDDAIALAESNEVVDIFRKYQKKLKMKTFLPVMRVEAVYWPGNNSSWYELFPRSQTGSRKRSGTFVDCEKMLDYVSSLGFNVMYLTPIHPIGGTNRRGKNGVMRAGKGDPGSPWAIGNALGGHKSINPDLGSMDDFRKLVRNARKKGVEIALDIAFQCSPDHPYVNEHPEWFYHRPDGSIRYAENPPKKYYDIYPINFDNPNWKELWEELKSVFVFWIRAGVRVFRVDNPHTKPFDFWEKILGEIKQEYPYTVFLAEAFTRPKIMYMLSRIGFTCSYSYFTWKNYDWEIRQYFEEIASGETGKHFRPVLFTNTPDILTDVLQKGGRPAFILRAVLASTLSPMWGIYSGYELFENKAVRPGSEEYANSEKYEIKARNLRAKGNIGNFLASLNRIRRENKQLQHFRNTEFLDVDNHNFVAYMRWAEDPGDPLIIVVNVNPFEAHGGAVKLPLWKLGIPSDSSYKVKDLMNGQVYQWRGEYNYVRLAPGEKCAHILKLER